MNCRRKFYTRSQSNSQKQSQGTFSKYKKQGENRMLKKKLQRMICGNKHLLFCLLKNNTQEKQLPHFHLRFKLRYDLCMVFPLCWCWDAEMLGVLSVQSQTGNCGSETRSFSAFGSQRDSARSASRLSSPAAFSPIRCSKLEMHFKCLKCLQYFKGIRAKMRRRN